MDRLPEELLLDIFAYLDSPPPSEVNLRDEPSLAVIYSASHVLKDISAVSKRWRRLAMPSLFQYARLRLDSPPLPHWQKCAVCGDHSGQTQHAAKKPFCIEEDYHVAIFGDGELLSSSRDSSEGSIAINDHTASGGECSGPSAHEWAVRFYHNLKDFLDFLEHHVLIDTVKSLVVLTTTICTDRVNRFPHSAGPNGDWRYACAAAFWQHAVSSTDLARIIVIAPPIDLACLANCAVDTYGDWTFSDMAFHILEMRLDSHTSISRSKYGTPVWYHSLKPVPHRYPGLALSSILNLRPWHSISVNEGAFLKAYGTYEYFERGPPSLVYSIKDCLTPRPTYGANVQRLSQAPLASVRKFTYTAIFPFATHLDFRELLPQLEEIDLQLGPPLWSQILNDPSRVGKAELEDCWSELIHIYRALAEQLATFSISKANMPRLKRIVCRDMARSALQEDLDEIFIPLCLPVWCETSPGVFDRLLNSVAEEPAYQGLGFG